MARSSKVEPCMFCDSLPCTCNEKPVKKAAPKKRAVRFTDNPAPEKPMETVDLLAEKSTMRSAMKASALAKSKLRVEGSSPVELETKAAVQVLLAAEILHPDEVEKYAHLAGTDARAQVWRERKNA